MKRLNILHLDPDDIDSPASGGGPIRTYQIYKRLAQNHNITVLTPHFENSEPEKNRDGIRYIRLGGKFRDHKSTYFISYYFLAPFKARKFDCDLLIEDLMPPTAATITPLINAKKIIASVQWFFAKEWAKQYKIPFHWYQKIGLRQYKNFVVMTHDMQKRIQKYAPNANFCIVPNGLEHETLTPTSQEKVHPKKFILYMGRIDFEQKGMDILFRSFSKIKDQTDLDLLIAGDGADMARAKNMATDLGLKNRVHFLGKVDFNRKNILYSQCQFVCIPSKYETFCMVALEAFAHHKTVLTFDIPFLDVVRGDFAHKIQPFDEKKFTEKMLELSLEPSKCQLLGEHAYQHSLSYTWDRIAELQEEYYYKVYSSK